MFKKVLRKFVGDVQEVADELLDQVRTADEPVGAKPAPVERKVLSICFDPAVPSQQGKPLSTVLGWNDVHSLMAGYIADLKECSYGYANFTVVEHIEVDGMPTKADGFAYKPDDFVRHWKARDGFHQPDLVDYHRILRDYDIVAQVNSGRIDEVWLWGFPYAGYYESIMAGPGAFWCNAPALKETDHAQRRFVIMGYNYQRGVGEMLENLGHRAESMLRHVFRNKRGAANHWERFARYDQTHPGAAEVGIMHFAPNSVRDYDWGNKTRVASSCDDWLNYPNLTGAQRTVDCKDWGDGDTRLHHLWWYRRLPHVSGVSGGISNNWWQYIIDPNKVR